MKGYNQSIDTIRRPSLHPLMVDSFVGIERLKVEVVVVSGGSSKIDLRPVPTRSTNKALPTEHSAGTKNRSALWVVPASKILRRSGHIFESGFDNNLIFDDVAASGRRSAWVHESRRKPKKTSGRADLGPIKSRQTGVGMGVELHLCDPRLDIDCLADVCVLPSKIAWA